MTGSTRDGGQLRLPVSRREQATIALLESARTNEALSEHARAAAAAALSEWRAGHRACLALFEGYADADARLAVIRAGLLHRLAAHAGPDAPPLVGLLAMGGPSVPGWLAPLTPALRAATEPATERAASSERVQRPELPALEDRAQIAAAMQRERNAEATSLELLACRDSGVRLQLCVPIGWHPVDGWSNADGPLMSVRRKVAGGVFAVMTWRLDVESWRAYAALVAGLWMADRAALGVAAAATVKRHGLDALGGLLAGAATPREAVERFAAALDEVTPATRRGRRRRQRSRSSEFRWPAAHAVVVGAIDRFVAAVDAEPLAAAPPEGTWVHVWDEDGREPYGAGRVVAAPPPSDRPRRGGRWLRRWRAPRVAAPADATPVLWVRVDGEAREVPLALVQVARPAPLFG